MKKKLTSAAITEAFNRLNKKKRQKPNQRLLEEVAWKLLEGVQQAKQN